MKFKVLQTVEELNVFLDGFERYVRVRLPMSYLENNEVVGAFVGEKMVGGYCLVTEQKLRIMAFIPDEVKSVHPFFKNNSLHDLIEVNGLWLSHTLPSRVDSFFFWRRIRRSLLESGKKNILVGFSALNKGIGRFHAQLMETEIYRGPVDSPASATNPQFYREYVVGYIKMQTIRDIYFRKFLLLFKKFFPKDDRGIRRVMAYEHATVGKQILPSEQKRVS